MSRVVFMRGKDWWLLKRGSGKTKRLHYPERIRVGELGKERVYVPERTCRMLPTRDKPRSKSLTLTCSECGDWHEWRGDDEERKWKHCRVCGAKVVSE